VHIPFFFAGTPPLATLTEPSPLSLRDISPHCGESPPPAVLYCEIIKNCPPRWEGARKRCRMYYGDYLGTIFCRGDPCGRPIFNVYSCKKTGEYSSPLQIDYATLYLYRGGYYPPAKSRFIDNLKGRTINVRPFCIY